MAEPEEERSKAHHVVMPDDLVSVVRGEANDAQVQKVRAALDDPSSEANAWLAGVEDWAKRTLVRDSLSPSRLGETLDFVQRMRHADRLTTADVARIIVAGAGSNPDPSVEPHPDDIADRMIAAIAERQPRLASEVVRIKTSTQRGR